MPDVTSPRTGKQARSRRDRRAGASGERSRETANRERARGATSGERARAPSTPGRASQQPAAAADAAPPGLRYVNDGQPGIARRRAGRGFYYVAPDGRRVSDADTLTRIRALAIPPAWTEVWICPLAHGHLQATGRDARGRKQYRYHARWVSQRGEAKFSRMAAFGRALTRIRRQVGRDLRRAPLSREHVLATIVLLLERTLIRVGNEEYARSNGSFGLTTLRDRHARVNGTKVQFELRAKSGVKQAVEVVDRVLARNVKRCRDLPGQTLFQYVGEDGTPQRIDSADVNDYLRAITGEDFTAKDFRTWAGTVLAAHALCRAPAASDIRRPASRQSRSTPARRASHASRAAIERVRKRDVVAAINEVSSRLGNTPAVCRKYYVHPVVLQRYMDGITVRAASPARTPRSCARLSAEEWAVLRFVEHH
jgi:DNA topoisomerase-1